MMKANTYSIKFVGKDRYKVIKVLEHKIRRLYNVYGGKIIEDRKDYTLVTFTLREDSLFVPTFHDIYRVVCFHDDDYGISDDTNWERV